MLHLYHLSTWGQGFPAPLAEPHLKWNQLHHRVYCKCLKCQFSVYAAYYRSATDSWVHRRPCFAWTIWSLGNEIKIRQLMNYVILLSSLFIWYPHHSDSHRVVCHPISLFKLQANGSFGDMTECHFTCWPAFELQVLSCVCLFREITAAPHLPSPLSVSNGSSTDKIQVRVYIWVTCYATGVFLQAANRCVFSIACHYGWRIAPFVHFPGL